MSKCLPYVEDGEVTGYMVFCPGCGYGHLFNTKPGNSNGVGGHKPTWTFNGDAEKPTFRASMLVRSVGSGPELKPTVCHSFVTDGTIQFLGDSTHKLAGQTVPLPEM